MTYWTFDFPDLKWTGDSLGAYFDGLMKRAAVYKPTFIFSENLLSLNNPDIYTINSYRFNTYRIKANVTNSTSTLNAIRSPLLNINFQTQLANKRVYFSRVTVLLVLKSSLPKQSVYNITATKAQIKQNNGFELKS